MIECALCHGQGEIEKGFMKETCWLCIGTREITADLFNKWRVKRVFRPPVTAELEVA